MNELVHSVDDVIAALVEGKVGGVCEHDEKLNNLNLCDVPFPPKVGLHFRADRCQAVVGVPEIKKINEFVKVYCNKKSINLTL